MLAGAHSESLPRMGRFRWLVFPTTLLFALASLSPRGARWSNFERLSLWDKVLFRSVHIMACWIGKWFNSVPIKIRREPCTVYDTPTRRYAYARFRLSNNLKRCVGRKTIFPCPEIYYVNRSEKDLVHIGSPLKLYQCAPPIVHARPKLKRSDCMFSLEWNIVRRWFNFTDFDLCLHVKKKQKWMN